MNTRPGQHYLAWTTAYAEQNSRIRRSVKPVYTIQPVVKPVWQPVKCLYTRYNRLSNRLSNRSYNWLYRVYKHLTSCQTRLTTGLTTGCIVYTASCHTSCTTRFDNQLNEQWLFVQHGWMNSGCSFNTVVKPVAKPVWQPVGCFVYTIQPVVKPVLQPVWQPAVSCKQGISRETMLFWARTVVAAAFKNSCWTSTNYDLTANAVSPLLSYTNCITKDT